MNSGAHIVDVLVVGVAATLAGDLWQVLVRAIGWPPADWGLIGRWVWHWREGRVFHASIAAADPAPNEGAIGWSFHYLVGIVYAEEEKTSPCARVAAAPVARYPTR